MLQKRLEEYKTKTQPLADFYGKMSVLHRIEGNRDREQVFADITRLIEGAAIEGNRTTNEIGKTAAQDLAQDRSPSLRIDLRGSRHWDRPRPFQSRLKPVRVFQNSLGRSLNETGLRSEVRHNLCRNR